MDQPVVQRIKPSLDQRDPLLPRSYGKRSLLIERAWSFRTRIRESKDLPGAGSDFEFAAISAKQLGMAPNQACFMGELAPFAGLARVGALGDSCPQSQR